MTQKLVSKKELKSVYGVPYSFAHIARLEADVLHPLMTRHMVGHRSERAHEAGIEFAFLVSQPQILERIESRGAHLERSAPGARGCTFRQC